MHARLVKREGNVVDATGLFARRNEAYVSKVEVAARFKVGTSTVDRWCQKGMPYKQLPGGRRFLLSLCEDWLDRST